MSSKTCLFIFLSLISVHLFSQQDSSMQLNEVEVRAYFESKNLLTTPSSLGIIDARQLNLQHDYSLVPVINTIPGVRMEERSPGSYRLSIRGSLLRSPFGIRNIKIYLDDFPLTDAGGNTYLNAIDAANINRIEILKGPEASIFGANSGGVIIINPVPKKADSNYVLAGVSGGSYGLLHQKFVVQESFVKYRFNFTQGFQRSDGYRENSNFKRHYAQLFQQLNYSNKGQLKALILYSNLNYRTPGGLTLAQYSDNPQSARPATAVSPGALQQQAGIINKTWYAGLSHQHIFNRSIRHAITIFGSVTGFENPFITNYETRDEHSYGLRSYIEIANLQQSNFAIKWQTGVEAQQGNAHITNYGNRSGYKDTLQAEDNFKALNHFYFTRLAFDIKRRLFVELASSMNFYSYQFNNDFPSNQPKQTRNFDAQVMPRIALAYLLKKNLALRTSASRGYSAPAIAEIRPSNLITNTSLEPENGWNYEAGLRINGSNNSFTLDACVFFFRLDDAIVRRIDGGGNEFFINSGGTDQTGFELQGSIWIIKPRNKNILRGLALTNGFTYNEFMFRDYSDATNNYNGNRLTGIPQFINVSAVNLMFPKNFGFFVQYNYTGAIPLNDANSVYATEYHLVQAKATWLRRFSGFKIEAFAGVDNILNQTYSLGNDLNAFGGRYYNAAPLRNYFAGVNLMLN